MSIIPQVARAMQTVLIEESEKAATKHGLIQRKRKLTGHQFVQTLVFGWLANPEATYDELASTAETVGLSITGQAIEQRFTQQAAETLKEVLDASVSQVISQNEPAIGLLKRFSGVYLADSSWISFPDELASVFTGTGGKTAPQSSTKIQLRWEITCGKLEHLCLTDGVTNDKSPSISYNPLPAGSLRIADLGYFSIAELRQLGTNGGLDKSKSQKKWRILTEFYAKLIAMIVQHWLFLVSDIRPISHSLTKASRAVKKWVFHFALNLCDSKRLMAALSQIAHALAAGCRIYSRRDRPSTYQRILQVSGF